MRTFEFNQDNDWTLEMVSDEEEVRQSIEHSFKTRLGEWFLDESIGLDRSNIESRSYNERDISDDLTDAALQDERVIEVLEVKLDFDRRNRKLVAWLDILATLNEQEERMVLEIAI